MKAVCMAGTSFRSRRAIRIGCAASRDGRTGHVAAYGDATTVRLDVDSGHRRFRLLRFRSRKEIDKSRPKSRRHNDQPTSEPPENLLVALVTQKPPQPTFELAFGAVGLRRKLGRIFSGEVNTIAFETTDQSVHVILK